MVAESIMLIEREELAGPDYIGDQKVTVTRPRLRDVAQGEVPLKPDARLHATGDFFEELLENILRGVSAQKYTETVMDAARAFGMSPSAVSQKMVSLTATKLTACQQRSWAEYTPFALFLDTVHWGAEAFLVARGVDLSGEKRALGFWHGSSENHEICEALFRDLARRGLVRSKRILFVTDGGSGLRKALRERFGKKLVPQRCAIHKGRNLQRHRRSSTATRPISGSRSRWSRRTTPRPGRCCWSWRRGSGLAPGGVRGGVDCASTEGARVAAYDAAVDQPDREPVLVGPAPRAEYHTHTREREAPTVARDGGALLRAAVQTRERLCRDSAGHGDDRGRARGAATGSDEEGSVRQP